jgi:hypothetical protein
VKIKLLTSLAMLFMVIPSFSQVSVEDTTWKLGGFGSVLFNQVAFSNWAAGGENSLSLTLIANAFNNYKFEKNYWDSYANLNYGVVSTQYARSVRKNVDYLNLGTRAGHEIGNKFYLTGLIDFTSQFTSGYNFPNDTIVVSKFLSPGYLLISPGIEWKPVDYFSLYFSPVALKFTFVIDEAIADAGTYGNEPAVYDTSNGVPVLLQHGKNIRSEFGALFIAAFQKDVFENVNLSSKLTLFDNYTDKVSSNRDNVDVNFNLTLNMQINKWLTTSFFANILYDHNIFINDRDNDGNQLPTGGPRTQINEGFGIGLTAKFGDELK